MYVYVRQKKAFKSITLKKCLKYLKKVSWYWRQFNNYILLKKILSNCSEFLCNNFNGQKAILLNSSSSS